VTLLTNRLTFSFPRSVTWSNDQQVPQEMEVAVIPLASPSFPNQGTFVGGVQAQSVVLNDTANTVSFNLVPSYAAGLTEPVLYRAEWREGGITGRTFSAEFAMPAQDCTFDELQSLGNVISGTNYVQQSQVGVANGVAALNAQGEVVDATGTPVADAADLTAVTAMITTETANRQAAIGALNSSLSASLAGDIASVQTQTAANLSSAVATLNGTIASNHAQDTNAITAEATARSTADATQLAQIITLQTQMAAAQATLATTATLTGGYLTAAQIPPYLIPQVYPVSGQAGMLALSTTASNGSLPPVTYGDIAIWTSGAVYMLMGVSPTNPQPSTLSNWTLLSPVISVNGKNGNLTLSAADVGAVALTTGVVLQSQIQGLSSTLAGYATTTALATLNTTVSGILSNTNYVMLDTSGPSAGYVNHAKLDAGVAYVNSLNEVTLKDGTIIASGTGSVDTVNSKPGPNVVLVAADVGALAVGASIPITQVTGLSTAIAGLVPFTDASVTNARTPTAHAATHAAAGSDPVTLSISQVTNLQTTLNTFALASTVSNQAAQIATLQSNVTFLLGGGTPSSSPIKAVWYDGTTTFTGVTNPATFQTVNNVQLKSPWGIDTTTGNYYYNPAGASANEWAYAYITPNGHLQLRKWNEANAPDPAPAYASDIATLNTTIATLAPQASLDALTTTVNSKANQSAVTAIQAQLPTFATVTQLNSLSTAVGNAATQSALNAVSTVANAAATQTSVNTLSSTVATLATQASVANLSTQVSALQNGQATKADLVSGTVPLNELPNIPQSQITGLTTALAGLAPLVGGLVPLANLPSIPQSQVTGLTAALAGFAPLVGGVIPSQYLPTVQINHVFTASNQAGMLAQSSAVVGDICVITASSAQGTYILSQLPASTLGNWILMPAPANTVTQVNGQSGIVNLTAANVGALPLNQAIPTSQVTGLTAQLATFATTTALTNAVAPLQSATQVQAALVGSVAIKQQVNYVATSAIPSLAGQQSIDGVLTPLNSLVLATAQPSSANNGLWVVQSGAWIRTTDFASGSYFLRGTIAVVSAGATQANTVWQETSNSGVVDTAANNWSKILQAGGPIVYTQGNGITINSNQVAVNVATGGGLSVTAGGVSVDTSIVTRKYSGFVPPGSTIAQITHNLNTTDICGVFIKEMSSGNQVLACPTITGPNTLTIEFASAPATNQWRVSVTG
jgi:hypothetical protein